MEAPVTSSIILYLKILYPYTVPPTIQIRRCVTVPIVLLPVNCRQGGAPPEYVWHL